MKIQQKNILVAPLNWGLGHATRSIPIIQKLEQFGFKPIIASDGAAFQLLKLEFPHLIFLELPSYSISYPKKGTNFRWKMIQSLPNMLLAAAKERKLVQQWMKEYSLSGIISDSRIGVYNPEIPSLFVTHQLQVLTGFTSWFSTKLQQKVIEKFDQCWIPDVDGKKNLSGKLGHLEKLDSKIKYIGPLSRFRKMDSEIKYDVMVLLSGPEPQRSILEKKLILELKKYLGKVIFIKGIVGEKQEIHQANNVVFYNFMKTDELQKAFSESEMVLCRSGYTTIMDLAAVQKKAFFIPTPGQFEQEYLAEKFNKEGIAPFCKQDDFAIEKLEGVKQYKGFSTFENKTNWDELFSAFK